MKKIIFTSILFISNSILFAQEDLGVKKNQELIMHVGSASTRLINKNISTDEFKTIDARNGFNFSFSYNKYYKRIGISIGIGASRYKQTVYQKGLFESYSRTDRDGNIYDLWINSDMKYSSTLTYLEVPVMLHLLLGTSSKFYGFVDVGIVNAYMMADAYNEKGHIENIGKYETANPYFFVISRENSYYGYKSVAVDKDNSDKYRSYNISFRASFGIAAVMTDRLTLHICPELTRGLSDITVKAEQQKPYQNVMGGTHNYLPTKTLSLGINVGLGFNL
jgi:hypothetical protein